MNLIDLFTYTDGANVTLSTNEEEAALIAAAQQGDESAKETLLLAYGRTIRAQVSHFASSTRRDAPLGGTVAQNEDDIRAAALLGFVECLNSHDPEKNPRLAGRIQQILRETIARECGSYSAFAIPERTMKRFFTILREAEHDVTKGLDLAPSFSMSRETFGSIAERVFAKTLDEHDLTTSAEGREESTLERIENSSPIWSEGGAGNPIADVEDRILVEAAFAAVDVDEEEICGLAYGFTEYDPKTDGEIAEILDARRSTVQRKRGKALDKMRKAIGAPTD